MENRIRVNVTGKDYLDLFAFLQPTEGYWSHFAAWLRFHRDLNPEDERDTYDLIEVYIEDADGK